MAEWAKIPVNTALQMYAMLRWWRGRQSGGDLQDEHPPMYLRMAKITQCGNGSSATGYGAIQFYRGDPHNRTLDTSVTVKCVVSKWFQKNQDVWVAAAACQNVKWVAVTAIIGPTFFAAPTAGELASPQDNPAPTTTCTDSVSIP